MPSVSPGQLQSKELNHPRHRLGVASLALAQLEFSHERQYHLLGWEGLSWDLGPPMKRQKVKQVNESTVRQMGDYDWLVGRYL
jgi:hypothetical protein